ncbi:MAG: hypothetical protein ACI9YU_001632 [Flavobacteriales bacterium]|jgi:hypothetical protein
MFRTWQPIFYALFLSVCFLLVNGYHFNTNDQAEHLPQVYQVLDQDLYPKDYFVPYSNSVFTVRFFFEKLMLVAHWTIGIEAGCFILTLLCIALLARSVMGITESFFPNSVAKWIAPILVLFVFYGFTIGGNHITYPSLISSTVAKAFGAFAFWKFLQNKYLVSGIVLGIGSLFQPLVGLQLGLLLISSHLLLYPRQWLPLLRFSIPLVALLSLILIPVFIRQSIQKPLETDQYWQILYGFRNFHHYLPSVFPIGHFIKATALSVIGAICFFLLRPKKHGFFIVFGSLTIIGMFVYSIGLELDVLPQIGKSQWFKTSIWLAMLSSIGIAGILSILPKITCVINHLAWSKTIPLLMISLLALLLNSDYLPKDSNRYMIGNRKASDLEKMHEWIAYYTPKNVCVLVSPNNKSFSCQAKRSMPIHFTAIVHEPEFMLEWYRRYSEIYGVTLDNLKHNAQTDAIERFETDNFRGHHYGIDLRLDNLETCRFSNDLGPVLHKEGTLVLTQFLQAN